MNERQAEAIAKALGGSAWQSGGGIWLVVLHREDGRVVVMSEEVVCEYENEEALNSGTPAQSIFLCTGKDDSGWWVVEDAQGRVHLNDPAMGVGWRWREEAEQEASELQSRIGIRCFVREQKLDDAERE